MKAVTKNGQIVLKVFANERGEIICPFCDNIHKHGQISGHRIAHCEAKYKDTYADVDGRRFYQNEGYYFQADATSIFDEIESAFKR